MTIPKIGLEEALDSIQEQVSIQNKEFTIIYENRARQIAHGGNNLGEKCFGAYRGLQQPCPGCILKPVLEGKTQANSGVLKVEDPNGEIKYLEISATPYSDKDGNLIGGIEIVRDITERMVLQQKLEIETITDPLTGIYNRRGLDDKLRTLKQLSEIHNHPLTIFFIDLDFLKQYNDSFGHPQGDLALQKLADILRNTARPGDVYGRIGGEEFLFILPETDLNESIRIAELLRISVELMKVPISESLQTDKVIYQHKTPERITVSIGISSYPETSQLEFLVGDADEALYQAKEKGRNQIQTFNK